MGQLAFCQAFARFENAKTAFHAFEAFKQWSDNANKSIKEDYCIYDIKFSDINTDITYTVTSQRFENCSWQCERILEFFKNQSGLMEVSQDIMVIEDSVNWIKGDDEETP